jgi:hypothetical protein
MSNSSPEVKSVSPEQPDKNRRGCWIRIDEHGMLFVEYFNDDGQDGEQG